MLHLGGLRPYTKIFQKLIKFGKGKECSLFFNSVSDEEKYNFMILRPVANVIKLFTAVRYDFS